MATLCLFEIVRYCDRLLRTGEFNDYEGAVNGLQVENRGAVTRVAAAVDASLATVRLAIDAGADLLVVHHGLFWGRTHPWTGMHYELLRRLLDNNLAIYSSHLPLDAHPRFGNNSLLCAALGLKRLRPFFFAKEQCLGFRTNTRISRADLVKRLRRAVRGEVKLLPGGPELCRHIGVVSGGAGEELKRAAEEGVDTFITGEGPHWTFSQAEELRINVLYGGHYATETFGLKALAAHLAMGFKVSCAFIHCPSGI